MNEFKCTNTAPPPTSLLGWCGNSDPRVSGNNSEQTGVGFDSYRTGSHSLVLEQRFPFQSQLDLAQMDTETLDGADGMLLAL